MSPSSTLPSHVVPWPVTAFEPFVTVTVPVLYCTRALLFHLGFDGGEVRQHLIKLFRAPCRRLRMRFELIVNRPRPQIGLAARGAHMLKGWCSAQTHSIT